MISDILCEQLVKRKFGSKQIFIGGCIALLGLILSLVLYVIGAYVDTVTGLMRIILFFCGVAITVFFLRKLMVEYEYAFYNGELTVDRITAKSKRKAMLSVSVKGFEKMGKYTPDAVERLNFTKIRDYSISKYDSDAVFALYKDEKSGEKTLLIFSPNEKLIKALKTSVNPTVFREAALLPN